MTKKILITGAGGFIGSHLVERCVELGYQVRAFVRYKSTNDWGWLEASGVKDEVEVVTGDVRDYDSISTAVKGCESVLHLAALIGIPYSYISPLAYIRTNIEGTYNVLQAARSYATKNVVITSTSETYGSAQYTPIDESHPLVGQSPYSASKIAADQLAISYYRSFDLPVKIARPFNTYGPRQSARAIIPTIISQVLNGQTTIKLGNLTPKRDFTFVKDTVEGIIAILQPEKLFGEVTNIGMNHEISIGELVKLIAKIIDVDITLASDEQRVRQEKSEVERLCCNNEKILSKTDWCPQFNLESGLRETVAWMKENMSVYKAEVYNV